MWLAPVKSFFVPFWELGKRRGPVWIDFSRLRFAAQSAEALAQPGEGQQAAAQQEKGRGLGGGAGAGCEEVGDVGVECKTVGEAKRQWIEDFT